ncbi:MAG: flagellar hook-length control protein FliK [Campylobacterales bacterium]|nr:flagellar hook-length control protein FliK [Campylobacterales bacterium]
MITLDNTQSSKKSQSNSPLSLSSKDEPKLSFSDLLKGISENKDTKVIQNGALVLAVDEKDAKSIDTKDIKTISKKETLLSMLKNDVKTPASKEESVEIDPKFTQNITSVLDAKEIKKLIFDAKKYLKEQILNSEGYKKLEQKELPRTLKGLAQLANKLGIDVSKITIESIKGNDVPTKFSSNQNNMFDIKKVVPDKEVKGESVVSDAKTITQKDEKLKDVNISLKDALDKKVINDKEVKSENVVADAKTAIQKDEKGVTHKDIKNENLITDTKAVIKKDALDKKVINDKEIKDENVVMEAKAAIQKDEKLSKEILNQPIFKQTKQVEFSTEQLVRAKSIINEKTPTTKTNSETLQTLLSGDKNMKSDLVLHKEISTVASTVISLENTQNDGVKNLESLLRGDSNENNFKQDGAVAIKSDSLEVKINEAKQMVRYLSQDVKQAIEDYKAPFTRIKVQLNPQKLGEIDLTVIQRGKNLIVNLSSNNAAINTLAMNANELRTQLTNNGINNATLNFSNGSQSDLSNSSGQSQNNHNSQRAYKEYNYFDNEERNEEALNSLEISVPYYA